MLVDSYEEGQKSVYLERVRGDPQGFGGIKSRNFSMHNLFDRAFSSLLMAVSFWSVQKDGLRESGATADTSCSEKVCLLRFFRLLIPFLIFVAASNVDSFLLRFQMMKKMKCAQI